MIRFPAPRPPGQRRRTRSRLVVVTLALGALSIATISDRAEAGIVATVPLASAGSYSVLAATTVTNVGPSVLAESIGLHPGTSIVGFPPGTVSAPGTIDAGGPTSLIAQADLTTAYVNAAGRSVEFTQTNPDLVGQTLIPGVYAATAKAPLSLSGQLVLDGQNNPNAVFIFQTNSTLITGSGSSIALINGASECNIFWQVGSSATLGSGSLFVGNILALTSITVGSSATVHGRAMARNGAVTLINDTFVAPSCVGTTETVPPTTAPPTPVPVGGSPTTVSVGGSPTTLPVGGSPTTVPVGGSPTTVPVGGSPTIVPVGGSPTIVPVGGSPTTVDFQIPATGGTSGPTAGVAFLALAVGVGAVLISRRRSQF